MPLGSCRRPRLPILAATGRFAAGIMVSASHNPAEDNGLKVLDTTGLKLDDDVEDELEALVLRADELPGVDPAASGARSTPTSCSTTTWRTGRRSRPLVDGDGLHVVLDTANGAAWQVGPRILRATGARVTVIHDAPDGDNINRGCGATEPASLMAAVRSAWRRRRVRAGWRRRPLCGR